MECGESISDTIIREIKEETGFNARIEKMIGIYSNPNHVIEYTNGEVRQQFSLCFHCIIEDGEIMMSDESIQLHFFNEIEIEKLDIHPSQRIRIEDYLMRQDKAFIR